MELDIDHRCFLMGRACGVCRIWLDRVIVRPLVYRTKFCILNLGWNRHFVEDPRIRLFGLIFILYDI